MMVVRFFLFSLIASLLVRCGYQEEKGKTETPVSVQPTFNSIQTVILTPKCIRCHSGPNAPKGIDLTSHGSLMRGGASGAVVVAEDPEASKLYQVIRSGQMPQGGPPLSEPEIKAVYDWIKGGAGRES